MFRKCALLLFVPLLAWSSAADAAIRQYSTTLSGPAESPANSSLGTGGATFSYNDATHMFSVNTTFNGLTGTTTASHIHAADVFMNPGVNGGTAGVATTTPSFTGFPNGVTAGAFQTTLDLTQSTSWNPAFITANGGTTASAESAFITFIESNRAYLNIHTSAVGSGEIRGFLQVVPEPATAALIAIGALAFAGRRRW